MENTMNMNIEEAGSGYFALKMVLIGDTKISSKYALIEKDNEVILELKESAQFSIETTEKQTAVIVMVGAGQSGTDTIGGVDGEMIEKTIELQSGVYYVSIGNPKLHGKTTMASVLDGSNYVFLVARSGTEMSEVLKRKEFNICSIGEYQFAVNRAIDNFVNELIESQKTKEAIAHNWAADTAAAQLKSLMDSEHNLEEMKRSFERTLYVWLKDLHQANRDMEFYRGIVMQTGELLGPEAFTSNDGTVGDSVLALKVPELVKKLVEENNSSKH